MEVFQAAFLTQIVKQVSSSLSWRSCSGLSKSGHSYWVRDNGLQQSQIILWGHRSWDRSLCSSWDSQLVFTISQSIHSPGNFPLLLADETNPTSQALSLDGKTISSPASSVHKKLGLAALHLLVQPHSRTNTALWAIYILFKPILGNKVMHNPCSASAVYTFYPSSTRFNLLRVNYVADVQDL